VNAILGWVIQIILIVVVCVAFVWVLTQLGVRF